jgi:uncharacterized membrane protein
MPVYLLAFFIGVVAGLRSLTPPAAASWAARLGRLHLEGTLPAFVPFILSRKAPVPFAARVIMGGTVLGAPAQACIAGTLGGHDFRRRLVKAIGGKDLPSALLDDAIAIGAAFWLVSQPA